MRRNLYTTWLVTAAIFVASLFFANTATASHAVGADLTYTCLGNNTYSFTLTFYRDCSGIAAPTSFTASVNNGCGIAAQTFTLSPVGACVEITPLCPTGTSTCNGGAIQGVTQCFYSGIYTFPAGTTCTNWTISASECCRNNVSTITNSPNFDLYVQATMNVNPSVCNSSPDFTQPPVPYVCAGQSFTYNHGVIDIEGDSLDYTPIAPQDGPYPGTNINYAGGFSAIAPLTVVTPPGFVVNPLNGQITFTPTVVGQTSVVAILVREYRNGVLISTVRRDVQIIVLNCGANQTPQLAPATNVIGAVFTPANNSGTFRVCPGQTMSFSVTANDGNAAQVLSILSNAATFPGAVVNVTPGAGNSRTFNFTWTPTAASTGVRTLAIEARDNNCPTYGFTVEGYTIIVQGVNGQANRGAFCFGSPTVVNLTAQAQEVAGGQYQWTANPPVPGQPVLPTNQNITVTITQQTTFTVRYQDNNCNGTDTIIVQAYGPVSASPAVVNNYCPTDPPLQLGAFYTNPAPIPPAACTATGTAVSQCTGNQVNRTIGTAVGVSANGVGSPYQGFWHDGRFQMLFTAAELAIVGVQPGLITRMQLNVSATQVAATPAPYRNFNINMGCTSATSLSGATGFIAGLSNVYTNVAGVQPTLGLNQYVFASPYRWDGVSSLVIEICYDNAGFTNYNNRARRKRAGE